MLLEVMGPVAPGDGAMLMPTADMDASLGYGEEGPSAGVAMDVFHVLVAVIAQGSVVVVGEEPDELIGAVLGRSKEPQGRAPCLCVAQVSLSGLAIGDQSGDCLGQGERSCCWRAVMLRISSAW